MIDKVKEKECLSNNKTCSFPECNHQCGYNPDIDDASIYCETRIQSEMSTCDSTKSKKLRRKWAIENLLIETIGKLSEFDTLSKRKEYLEKQLRNIKCENENE